MTEPRARSRGAQLLPREGEARAKHRSAKRTQPEALRYVWVANKPTPRVTIPSQVTFKQSWKRVAMALTLLRTPGSAAQRIHSTGDPGDVTGERPTTHPWPRCSGAAQGCPCAPLRVLFPRGNNPGHQPAFSPAPLDWHCGTGG